jgi:hypothetical protein
VRGLPPIPEYKLSPCKAPGALQSGSHNEVERWATEAGFAFRECQDRQAELAETVRVRQAIEGGL